MSAADTGQRDLDVVLEAPASVSIYLQALTAAGRDGDAADVRAAHRAAADVALVALERYGLWFSLTAPEAALPHRYKPAASPVQVVEHDSTQGGLHTHVLVHGEPAGGVIDRGTASRAMPYVRRRYDRELVDALSARLGLILCEADGRPELTAVPASLIDAWRPQPCRALVGAAQLR